MKTLRRFPVRPWALTVVLSAGLLACGVVPDARAIDPDLPFSSGSTGAEGPLTFREIPAGRTAPTLAYDPVRQEVVMFGGFISNVGQGDTWVWRGGDWIRRTPAVSPPTRWSARMVWDAVRNEMVLFGGTRETGRLNDTWVWNGTTWAQRNPTSSPSARDSHVMAFDATRERVVMFSGNGGGAETWLWDGTNWTQVNPSARPPASGSSAMEYHAATKECVLFGNAGQTWTWNGTTWTQRTTLNTPAARNFPTLVVDGTSNTLLLFSGNNRSDQWVWNGSEWTETVFDAGVASPQGRQYHAMAWHSGLQQGVMFGGDIPGVDNYSADTWLWNGTRWSFLSGKEQFFDLSQRPNGTYHFTTINVPQGVTVRFKRNTGNTPVRWLATGDVTINGTLDLGGQAGATTLPPGVPAQGGPGGFDGGRGAVAVASSASPVGSPGQGPGGGAPGTAIQLNPDNIRDGQPGSFAGPNTTYGNAFLQPLVGGSGGGGGAASNDTGGGHGGGGGGAILIASSRDIIVNGIVRANGGDRVSSGISFGGVGAGGAILLRADRVSGPGTLQAFGGNVNLPNGRIRVEAYTRSLTGSRIPAEIVALPAAAGELNQMGTLVIARVSGANVAQPPTGNLATPDVVFTATGPIEVVVNGTGIPNGTAVRLRITTATGVIDAPPRDMVGGTATFNVTVPRGIGTLQATAQFSAP